MTKRSIGWLPLFLSAAFLARGETRNYSVIFGGKNLGHLTAEIKGDETTVDFDFKNNGRGPTISEVIRSGPHGLPVDWSIRGTTTFGSKVEESFKQAASSAEWIDSTGKGSATITKPALYVSQEGSAWSDQIIARALLRAPGMSMSVLPGGTLRLEKGETLNVQGSAGPLQVTRYDLVGLDLTPSTILLDANGDFFAEVSPYRAVIRKGYESESERLSALAAKWRAQRFSNFEKEGAHHYAGPVRIRNVRIFDSKTAAVTQPLSVLVRGREISAIASLDSPPTPGEVTIDGEGGMLIPGMYEMHSHTSQDGALLNVLAGITSVRDMGNDNLVLDQLIGRIESGEIGGPRVVRSGFIEGKSPFSANYGFVVDSLEKALEAVRWYGARGYWQIKIYNSTDPAWAPAIAKEAHRLGMRVAGHVPAFSTADKMIEAGYDEITHINQFMLGWVIQPTEDTRTLFRFTAMKRFSDLELTGSKVQHTIDMMTKGNKAIDPTLGILERLMLGRDGQVPSGAVDYIDHMPVGLRRSMLKARIAIASESDDRAYREGFDKIIATTRMLHERGVFIVFGTDTGGSFTYHRELELYQRAGMTAPEILKRATFDSAKYLGQDQRLGSIEKGKLADFFLVPGDPTKELKAVKTIRMVVKDGTFYFPSEIYPKFGIEPFTSAPKVTLAPKVENGTP